MGMKTTRHKKFQNFKMMTAAGKHANLERISGGAENHIMYPVACFIRTKSCPKFISPRLQENYQLPLTFESRKKLFWLLSIHQLKIMNEITPHLWITVWNCYTQITVVDNQGIDLLLGTTFITEHILASLMKHRNVSIRNSITITIVQ